MAVEIGGEVPGSHSPLQGDKAMCEVVVLTNAKEVITHTLEEALRNKHITLEYREATNPDGERVYNQVRMS